MLGNADLTGLLCMEPALEGALDWHIEGLRKKVAAARFPRHDYDSTAQQQESQSQRGQAEETAKMAAYHGGISTRPAGHESRDGGARQQQPWQEMRRRRSADAWPFSFTAAQCVASLEFDSRATLGDEESLSSAPVNT